MPRRRKENLASTGDIRHGSESGKTSISRFAVEKPLSPRASKGVKFKDKVVRVQNSIRPPHSDLPLEFVKNANNVFVVQTKSSGSQQQPQVRKGASRAEEELVKYMSKVPNYLQKGEKLQDNNALNFGVLDWDRLEKWMHKQEKTSVNEKITRFARENTEALVCSKDNLIDEKQEMCLKDTARIINPVNLKPDKCKDNHVGHDSCVLTGKSSSQWSNFDRHVLETVSRKLSNSDGEAPKCSENIETCRLDAPLQYCNGKQESIVLLLPKDFSGSSSSEVDRRASLDAKSAEHNWGSFSDIFSIDEIHPDESFSGIPHSFLPNNAVETMSELDLKLDTLIKAQGIEPLAKLSDMPVLSGKYKIEAPTTTSVIPKAFSGPDRNVQRFSAEIYGESNRHSRFSFGIARITKSLSFREGSVQPPLSSSYMTAKSGPAKPECSTKSGFQNSNRNGRARVSPIRRLLDPLLRSKAANQLSEKSKDLRMKPQISMHVAENEKLTALSIKARLHLTFKSGLPLFKFVVETTNEIFASTVKSLSTLGKVDVSWLYTFYSVQKVKKRSGGWKSQRVKSCGFGYNVVGQMKVSEPHFPSCCKQKSSVRHMVKESVLYNVDVSEVEAASSEIKTSRELAAIVVNIPDTPRKSISLYNEYNLGDCLPDFEHEEFGHIVVILPRGDHSLPHEGVPSSLINRWKSGGSCDCGGWDIGCKLRILSDEWQHYKFQKTHCGLYDQEETMQCNPFFSLIPLRDGLFSVEFDRQISSLQALSISVALINSQKLAHDTDASDQVELKHEFGNPKASMGTKREGLDRHTPHPPLSPVGRV